MTDSTSANPSRDDLPVPDYDHLPLGSLTHRIRSLDQAGLDQLIRYEEQHGARVPALQVLKARRAALNAGAEPSGGPSAAEAADLTLGVAGGSAVSPATEGPVTNPPPHGVPGNPGQR